MWVPLWPDEFVVVLTALTDTGEGNGFSTD